MKCKNQTIRFMLTYILLNLLAIPSVYAQEDSKSVYAKIPIQEVTVFKDGHAFLLHEGQVPVDPSGDVLLDYLPNPVLGTFWAYSADKRAKLSCVISGRDKVDVQKNSTSIKEMIQGNIGKQIIVRESNSGEQPYKAAIVRFLEQAQESTNNLMGIVLLKISEGIKAVPVSQIQGVTFLDNPSEKVTQQENKDTLSLKLDWGQKSRKSTAKVGMAYVQRGIRWIPNYRVEIDGKGKALIKLQGTIINELADLEDVQTHLVIGVPRFVFEETPDPISLQETVAQLSQHFHADNSTAYAFHNAIITQQRMLPANGHSHRGRRTQENRINLGPELEAMQKREDLFIFTLDHITLKKGQRLVVPITEFTLNYRDIYAVDIQFAPPLEMRRNFNSDQHLKLARLFHAPKAVHKLRLTNDSDCPLTTAPALIFKNDRILAQGMMTYTSIGGQGDLEVTTAVEIKVENTDQQTKVTTNAVRWNSNSFNKVDMEGTIKLTNYSEKTAELHVSRSILGNIDQAVQDGTVKQLGHGYNGLVFESGVPFWWNWCNWPWWWYHFNSIGQANWTVQVQSQKTISLKYNWQYFWQ